MPGFSVHLLDAALSRQRERREELRQKVLALAMRALDELSQQIPFAEAFLFGSVTKSYKFTEDSDVDIGFVGLADEHFFWAMAFLSRRLERDVHVMQIETVPFGERIKREGMPWTKKC